jgi:hypothetical protein
MQDRERKKNTRKVTRGAVWTSVVKKAMREGLVDAHVTEKHGS